MVKKHQYSEKKHRQVEHIKRSEEERGISANEAEAIGYATVNKRDPRKHKFTAKQDRQVKHIQKSEEARGKSKTEARRIGYATVNKRRS